jgi:FKBP-type peptidyl-prolyl cis-trans isomerase (trigger factor)
MINLEIKKLPGSEMEISGEIEADVFESFRNNAVKELSTEVKIDGFRPGNAPEKVLIEKVGESVLLETMAELALQKEYQKILEENKIFAIGRPQITITKMAKNNPLGFKIKTAVVPETTLPDYKKIASGIKEDGKEFSVGEKEVEDTINHLRKMRAKKEGEKEILPEADDEFAQSVGKFENLQALKDAIKSNITEEKKMKAKEKRRIDILSKIADSTKMEIPKILTESEKNKMAEEMKQNTAQMGLKWEDYLKHLKKTEEEIKNSWEKEAEKRIKFGMVLSEIAKLEKMEVPEEELKKETEKIMEHYKNMDALGEIDENMVKDYAYGILMNEKVFKLLESC